MSEAQGATAVLAPPAARGTVLVVDDDEGMRETVIDILAANDVEAIGAGSAQAAHRRLTESAPAVALVDHRLPDATGVELGAELKGRDDDITVLLMTGYASLENAIAAVGHLDGYLTKPVPPRELLRVVQAGLENTRLRRENRSLLDELQRAKLRLEASVEERTGELAGLEAMADAVAASSGLEPVLEACLTTAASATDARYAGLYLRRGEDDAELTLAVRRGDAPLPPSLEALAERSTSLGQDVVPLVAAGDTVGALVLGEAHRRGPMFLRTLASSAAVAIQNAQRLGRERETVTRLSELSRMKSTFLATVSHELRTPLAAVIRMTEMLGRRLASGSTERQAEIVELTLDQARRLDGLIDDLFEATRVEFGGLRVRSEPIDAGRPLRSVTRLFAERGSDVRLEIDGDLPPVMGDEGRLEQVLTNLVGNAVKHSPEGAGVAVRAHAENGGLRVDVVDAGPGIPPELLPLVFDPFAQGSRTDGQQEGLGLGLYIARGLVEAMGGTIHADSRPGSGSTFTVRLRLADAG